MGVTCIRRTLLSFLLSFALAFVCCPELCAIDSTAINGIRDLRGMTADTVAGKEKFAIPGTYSFNVPEGIGRIWATLSAGGGGGSGSRECNSENECMRHCGGGLGGCANPVVYGAAGGTGGHIYFRKIAVTPGSVITVIVGEGGRGNPSTQSYCGTYHNCNGWAGGNSCVADLCATGGGGGVTGYSSSSAGSGGNPSGQGGTGGQNGGNGSPGWVEIEW